MAFNKSIDERIQKLILNWQQQIDYKKMFGGVCYLLNGNMVFGIYKDSLILRLDEEKALKALESNSAKPFDITGRPMKGWVMENEDGFKSDDELANWLNKAKQFVETLPVK